MSFHLGLNGGKDGAAAQSDDGDEKNRACRNDRLDSWFNILVPVSGAAE